MLIPSGTTSVPNAVFDEFLPQLKCAELKILLLVIRQTLGWEDKRNGNERKSQDWISSSQMRQKTGCSERAITTAIESLVSKKLISVFDQWGGLLDSPKQRKGKTKLFFSLTSANSAVVENKRKTDANECNSRNTSAIFAEDFRKKYDELQQKVRITKETLTKETSTK